MAICEKRISEERYDVVQQTKLNVIPAGQSGYDLPELDITTKTILTDINGGVNVYIVEDNYRLHMCDNALRIMTVECGLRPVLPEVFRNGEKYIPNNADNKLYYHNDIITLMTSIAPTEEEKQYGRNAMSRVSDIITAYAELELRRLQIPFNTYECMHEIGLFVTRLMYACNYPGMGLYNGYVEGLGKYSGDVHIPNRKWTYIDDIMD